VRINWFKFRNRFTEKILKMFIDLFLLINRLFISKNKKAPSNGTLIISLHKLGDTIFTIPTIWHIQKEHKKITILCFEDSKEIYTNKISNVEYFTVKNYQNLKTKKGKKVILDKIRELNPINIFDLTGTFLTFPFLHNSNAKNIIGIAEKYLRSLYTNPKDKRTDPHLIDLYLDIVDCDKKDRIIYKEQLFELKSQKIQNIVVFPFGGWSAKEWPIMHYINSAEFLKKQNIEVSFISPVNSIEKPEKEKLNYLGIKLIETSSIKSIIEKLDEFDLIISNDTGPLYIAAMLGKYTFTIYGPTNPEYSKPFGTHHDFIQNRINCSPKENFQYCHKYGGQVGCNNFRCMNELSIERVSDRVMSFIKRINEQYEK